MRRLLFALVPALLLALAVPAQAQTAILDRAAQELRRNPVYVDGSAERSISSSAADSLRERIRGGRSPIYIAVLPGSAASEAGGDPAQVPSALNQKVGLAGTYAVVVGNSFRAGSTVLPRGQASSIASSSFQSQSGAGTEAVLRTFVDRVNDAVRGGSASGGGGDGQVFEERPSGETTGGSGDGGGAGTLLLLLALGGGGLFLWSRSRRQRTERQEEQRQFEGDRQMLQAELSVLGSDVMELEPEVTMHPDARPDYDAGVTRYRSAQAAMEYADDQVDLVRVGRVIEEGRYAMARARARIAGREPPPPPESLTRPGRHDEPALDVDERGEPVYVGYGGMPWYGGAWFGGGGSLLTGLMLGSMLGGGWGGWGGGWGGHEHGHSGDEGGGDTGWAGGGDWGGGDFGVGDFGGGDVGGGDW